MVQNQLNPALYQNQLPYHSPTIEELAAAQQQAMQLQVVAAAAQHTQQSIITPISQITTAQAPIPTAAPGSTCSDVTTSTTSIDSQPLQLLQKDSKSAPITSTTPSSISLSVNT